MLDGWKCLQCGEQCVSNATLADIHRKITSKLADDVRSAGHPACTVDNVLLDAAYAQLVVEHLERALAQSEQVGSHLLAVIRSTLQAMLCEARSDAAPVPA